jgi:very-short-patch-repair endonuclease
VIRVNPETDPDARVAAIASRQRGLIRTAQLHELGIGARGIQRRLARGALHRFHRGVYLVGHTAMAPLAAELAAVYACGTGAVLSHSSAASLWAILDCRSGVIHVTAPSSWRSRRGVRVHQTKMLLPVDRRHRHGIPVTAPARTLLDLAGCEPVRVVERAYDEALAQRLTSTRQIREALERHPLRRGNAVVEALLARDSGPTLTRSEAEELLLALIRQAGLPIPEVNARVGRYEVDFLWRAEQVIVEVDGYRYHGRGKFESDRVRDADLQLRHRVIRVTWRQLTDEPLAVVARIARALAAGQR